MIVMVFIPSMLQDDTPPAATLSHGFGTRPPADATAPATHRPGIPPGCSRTYRGGSRDSPPAPETHQEVEQIAHDAVSDRTIDSNCATCFASAASCSSSKWCQKRFATSTFPAPSIFPSAVARSSCRQSTVADKPAGRGIRSIAVRFSNPSLARLAISRPSPLPTSTTARPSLRPSARRSQRKFPIRQLINRKSHLERLAAGSSGSRPSRISGTTRRFMRRGAFSSGTAATSTTKSRPRQPPNRLARLGRVASLNL